MTNSVIEHIKAQRKADHLALEALSTRMTSATASERRTLLVKFDAGMTALKATDQRIEELVAQEDSEIRAGASRVLPGSFDIAHASTPEILAALAANAGGTRSGARFYTNGPATYDNPRENREAPSFFRDMINAQRGSADAADRLRTNNSEQGMDSRALGNTGATGSSGASFAPPEWLLADWVRLARPGRVTADLFHIQDMPMGVSSINIPAVATGTTTGVQASQNTAVSQTDMTTGSLSSGIVSIAGKQIVSQQLIDQSQNFDEVVLEDLSADYAKQLNLQCISGSGAAGQLRGYLTATSTNTLTWTTATPTAVGLYGRLAQLQGQINATRFKKPDAVIMSPRRWAWFASYVDSSGRPLVVPTSGGFNAMATADPSQSVGHVGSVLGMDVFTDPSMATNLGAGTNQDIVSMIVRDDIWFWESPLRAEVFTAPYADSMAQLLRVYAYSALIPDRYPASLGQITGTGLVTPTFAA